MSGERGAFTWNDGSVRAALDLPSAGSDPRLVFSGISTDTRTLAPGALFVALAGERYDGHDHLQAAAMAGARGAVVRSDTRSIEGLTLYRVPDTLRALGDLGRARRRSIAGPVVAVTGSNGKTSTKEMLAAVLGTSYRVHATRANDNNLVGIPLTILASPPHTEALVLEAGANQVGEIARAREIIEPTVAVITNVAASHLEGFGSLDGILREKLALADRVPLAIVGTEPPELARLARERAQRVVSAGLAGADRVPQGVRLVEQGRPVLRVDDRDIRLPLVGRHQAANAMLAWTLAEELGLDRTRAAAALERFTIPGGRGELQQLGGLTILNDCYNANPSSFAAAIATAASLRPGRRLVFIAGTMRELGPEAPGLHAAVARQLVDLAPDLLAATGDFVEALAPYTAGLGERLLTAPDVAALGVLVADRLRGDELVVLKASRGVALERIIPHLTAR